STSDPARALAGPAGQWTAAQVDGWLAAPAAGDLTLLPGSPLVDGGVPVPNVSDRPGLDYAGAAPDLGATERVP
ncbi:MAG TPA: hypothetical protein VG370_15040, partial [Chloroflexota bacterium]|nr:hypothetical protein [Chloroflexota bacterium]